MQTANQMQIPLVDLKMQYYLLKDKINKSVFDVLEECSFVRGPKLQAFEEAFARYLNISHCIGLNSGTDALFLSLKALGVKPGDEVITVPFTFFATAEAIVNAGASVKFVDIDPERCTLDPRLLKSAITSRTVGIIPVHLYGMPADMDPILEIAQKHHLWVLEDACQAHGALYKGLKAGTLANAAAFSFYPSKNLGAFGDGGAVVTQDSQLAEKIRRLRDHGQSSRYHSEAIGYNSRLDSIQAAILLVKLEYLDEWNRSRREIASAYNEVLKDIKEISLPKSFEKSREVFHVYAIRAQKRNELAHHLENNGISTGVHYPIPLHEQPPFISGKQQSFPVSEKLAREVLSIPMYPELSRKQVNLVGEKIKAFYQ